MITYHYQHWKLWLCNLLFCVWNANDENHKPLTHNWLKGKRIAAVGCRAISSAHVGNVGLYHLSSGTTSVLTVQYFQLLFRKISHEGHVLFFVFAATASPLPPASSSVLSDSSVLTVVAYLYSTLPWSLLHLQSLQDSIFTVSKMRTPYGREGKLGDACSEHEFLSYHQVFGCAGLRWSAGKTQGSVLFQPHHVFPDEIEGGRPSGSSCSREKLSRSRSCSTTSRPS